MYGTLDLNFSSLTSSFSLAFEWIVVQNTKVNPIRLNWMDSAISGDAERHRCTTSLAQINIVVAVFGANNKHK